MSSPPISNLGSSMPPWLSQIISMSMITAYLPGGDSGIWRTLSLFLMGWLLEMGRTAYGYFSERWRFQYSVTAEFHEGDPSYDWIMVFLTKEQVWKSSWNFRINAKTLQRRGGLDDSEMSQEGEEIGNAEYVPTYQDPQLFKWRKHWISIRRCAGLPSYDYKKERAVTSSTLYLTVYTRDVKVVSALVEDAREKYLESSKPHVIIHTSTSKAYSTFHWNDTKRKPRRSLDSVVLEPGVMDSIVTDTQEFLNMEDWYRSAGIPYRRGYLLHGPPGSGKSSTIYALAGELGLEIYSISLASNSIDDAVLAQAVAAIPKRSIFLLEDIDCAFSRGGNGRDDESDPMMMAYGNAGRTSVTLSGLLNILDGVASQEGILFFATTNHIEDLDGALIRPGRIDRKIQYYHTVREQAVALFKRFFPISHCTAESAKGKEGMSDTDRQALIDKLSTEFADVIPEKTFTAAEIQGFLLSNKFQPEKALKEAKEWVVSLLQEKRELEEAKRVKREKRKDRKDAKEVEKLTTTLMKLSDMTSNAKPKVVTDRPEIFMDMDGTLKVKMADGGVIPLPADVSTLSAPSAPPLEQDVSSRGSDTGSWTITNTSVEEEDAAEKKTNAA